MRGYVLIRKQPSVNKRGYRDWWSPGTIHRTAGPITNYICWEDQR